MSDKEKEPVKDQFDDEEVHTSALKPTRNLSATYYFIGRFLKVKKEEEVQEEGGF